MVIMDPHHVVVLDIRGNRFREQAVGFGVGIPCGLVECNLTGVVVEKRPEDGVWRLAFLAIAPS